MPSVNCQLSSIRRAQDDPEFTEGSTVNCKVKHGFTLVELLVVITIITSLVGITSVALNNARDKGRDSRRKQDLASIKGALTLYFQDNGQYPYDSADLTRVAFASDEATDWIPNIVSTYIQKLPKDPRQASLFNRLANLFQRFGAGGLPQPQVAAAESATIDAAFDGDVTTTLIPSCATTGSTLRLEGSLTTYRSYIRFSLGAIPAGSTINSATLTYNVTSAGTNQSSLQAYNQNGQADPEADGCSTRKTNTANDSTPYLSNTDLVGSTGIKNLTLPAEALTDIQTANDAVDRFSVAFNAGSSNGAQGQIEALENAGVNHPQLTINYTPPAPPTPTPTPSPSPSPLTPCSSAGPGEACKTAVPVSPGNYHTWNGDPNWDMVNDTPAGTSDGDATRIGFLCSDCVSIDRKDSWFFGNPNIPPEVTNITKVRLWIMAKRVTPPDNGGGFYRFLRISGVDYQPVGGIALDTSYQWFSADFNTNPQTPGDPWKPTEITSLEGGVWDPGNKPAERYVTAAFIEVYYPSTPIPTPTPTPISSPTPSPTPSPGCASKVGVYCYLVTMDHQNYTLWAQLENLNDPDIYNKPTATCTDAASNPDTTYFNYCLKPEF